MFHVLLGESSVMQRAASGAGRFSAEKCGVAVSSKIRSQWISSDTSTRSCVSQNAASFPISWELKTRPSGFCGLHNRNTFVSGVTAFSRAAQSNAHKPSVST